MSTITYVFMKKQEKYQYFSVEKYALSRAMTVITSVCLQACLYDTSGPSCSKRR